MVNAWETEKEFEVDAAAADGTADPFFATFPYPYMNGPLHIGHASTFAKADFAVTFQRLMGRPALLAQGWHVTGMPIQAAAGKLAEELAAFGTPPKFPDSPHFGRECTSYEELKKRQAEAKAKDAETAKSEAEVAKAEAAQGGAKGRAKKTKTASKTGASTRQWDILLSSGLTAEEIPAFATAEHWLGHFPPDAVDALKAFGAPVDWRRSFITTKANPFYDSFVKWQFRKLEAAGKLKFGLRYSIYSPKDGQNCADHDRASGEGVGTQEYTLVKLRIVEGVPAALEGRRVFLVPATLRPETMYGQTNVFVLPEGEYGAYEVKSTKEQADGTGDEYDVFIMSERAARNLSYQGYSAAGFGKLNRLTTVVGTDLVGCACTAPLSSYEKIYALPMFTISMTKGTGVVTSVPSDSPDDFAALRDFQSKAPLRAKYGLADECVLPFAPVPIIRTEEFGDLSAVRAVEEAKIKSQNDKEKLALAKDAVYKAGFYSGVFLVGKYEGQKVQEAKTAVRDDMIEAGDALQYWEPAGEVISRSGDECVVCPTDQWYIDYSQEEWKAQVRDFVSSDEFNPFNEELRKKLLATVDWLHEWGCSRSFGLGTVLPQDPNFLIESLSDSTVYMAYYTVAHLLQAGNLDPAKVVLGPANVDPALTDSDDFWDYIFLRGDSPPADIPRDTMDRLRNEFEYWYPFDVRCSGKDLATNHLVFSLFHHSAIFPRKYWPRGMKCGGFLEIDKEKMAKSKGNFLRIIDALDKFSASGTRLGLANAGDSLDSANFAEGDVNKLILRLYVQLEWFRSTAEAAKTASDAPTDRTAVQAFADEYLEHAMRHAVTVTAQHMRDMLYHEALTTGFHELQNARDSYIMMVGEEAVSLPLLLKFARVQVTLLAPFTPHFSDYVWRRVLGNERSVLSLGNWPTNDGPVDSLVLKKHDYLQKCLHDWRKKVENEETRGKKKADYVAPTKMTVHACSEYTQWQRIVLDTVRPLFDQKTGSWPAKKELFGALQAVPELKDHMGKKGKAMPFFSAVSGEVSKTKNMSLLDSTPDVDEYKLFLDNIELIQRAFPTFTVAVHQSEDPDDQKQGAPGKPYLELSVE
jgi:leucyl-tRNA synthetase